MFELAQEFEGKSAFMKNFKAAMEAEKPFGETENTTSEVTPPPVKVYRAVAVSPKTETNPAIDVQSIVKSFTGGTGLPEGLEDQIIAAIAEVLKPKLQYLAAYKDKLPTILPMMKAMAPAKAHVFFDMFAEAGITGIAVEGIPTDPKSNDSIASAMEVVTALASGKKMDGVSPEAEAAVQTFMDSVALFAVQKAIKLVQDAQEAGADLSTVFLAAMEEGLSSKAEQAFVDYMVSTGITGLHVTSSPVTVADFDPLCQPAVEAMEAATEEAVVAQAKTDDAEPVQETVGTAAPEAVVEAPAETVMAAAVKAATSRKKH